MFVQAGLDALRNDTNLDAVQRYLGFCLMRLSEGKYETASQALEPGSVGRLFLGEGQVAVAVATWVDVTFPLAVPANKKEAVPV